MAVTNDFTASELDLNGQVNINSPTALVWGPDGRLYVTEQDGDINVLTVAFGDKNPGDADPTANFYVTDAEYVGLVKAIPNYNDDGSINTSGSKATERQVTGIDVTQQFDSNGDPVLLPDGTPATVMYVTSSDSRIGAGGSGNDAGLDTNSGMITKLTQQQDGSWEAVDLVRGLARSEENHATNGLEVIQEIVDGKLVSERMIVAVGGNANTGAPSNNFAGQQEQPYSAAILEVDLTELAGLPVEFDTASGRNYVYDLPTLNDPTRDGTDDGSDPFGGNDGLNSAKLIADGPVQIYSAGYRNAYDVEVTDDGRVWTYDNGANNNWGGRPAGEDQDGDTNSTEAENLNDNNGLPPGFVATNLFVEDNSEIFGNFDPQNWDQLHEVTRSDDLNGRSLSAGQGGASLYSWDHPDFDEPLQLVYGGHPNPTRAEGARAGILYSPESGVGGALLMVSNVAKDDGSGGTTSDFLEVIEWLTTIGYDDAFINATVVAVDPGVRYSEDFAPGFGGAGAGGRPTTAGVFSLVEDANGPVGLPSDIDEIVFEVNAIEGNYLEAGYTDGSLDTGKGSINGLTEYTSDIFDGNGVSMKGALIAASLNQGQYYVIGRDGDGVVQTTTQDGRTIADDRVFVSSGGAPLGLASIGDDLIPFGNEEAFKGSVWGAIYKQNGPVIEILQPGNPDDNPLLAVYAGQEPSDPTDNDLDGVDHINDPFDFDADNGVTLASGSKIELNFSQVDLASQPEFSGTIGDTGLMGAALDGVTPNRDALTGTFDDDGDGQPDAGVGDGFPEGLQEDGLFDNAGNIIPGGNAPILQIKSVRPGTAIGSTAEGGNTLRDGLHTGVKIEDDVQRLVAEVEIFNWYVDQPGEGRISGLTFGDGTQSNFVRFVYGDIGGGVLGFEIGVEVDDVYQVLTTVTDPDFTEAFTGTGTALNQKKVTLQLEIADIGGAYTLLARYNYTGEPEFNEIDLGGATLPEGVLRAVLDGDHQISDGDTTLDSGAAIGIVAEKGNAQTFTAVDFDVIRVEAFGNEILAETETEAEAGGTPDDDTVIYTGGAADIQLAADVENIDATGATGTVDITGNALDNVIKVGAGTNTVTTGEGSDSVRGTLDDLDGDTIDDFSRDDELVIEGLASDDIVGDVGFAQGSAILTINGKTITLDGPDFTPENFDAADGASYFDFEDTSDGLRITSRAPLSPVVAINSGGGDVDGLTLRDTVLNFVGDGPGDPKNGFSTTGTYKAFGGTAQANFDYPDTELDPVLATEFSGAGPIGYSIDVPNGTYLVDFLFSEIFWGFPGGGSGGDDSRVFDVSVEGDLAFDDLDVFEEAGGAGNLLIKTQEVTVTDGSIDISAVASINQAKFAGIVVWDVGGGFVPVDATDPVVEEISLENPQNFGDGTRTATVVVTDETGFADDAFDGLTGSVLQFSGYTPDGVADPTVVLSNDNKTATLTFEVTGENNAWIDGTTGTISLAAGVFNDAAGNGTAAASNGFVIQTNLDALDRGQVVRAINLGTTDATPGGGAQGLDPDPLDGNAVDNNRYGGAIAEDSLITDAFGNPIAFEADNSAFHSSPKANSALNNNVDGELGSTGSNAGGVDLDGSAYHTYRDSGADFWTSTYDGFANGTYIVELHFAELFQTAADTRVGGFSVNGSVFDDEDAFALDGTKLTNTDDGNDTYDAFAAGAAANGSAVGADTPTVIRKAVTVTDGTITVDVDASGAGQAGYSAIVVYEAVDPSAPPSLSIGDVSAAEGEDATITITRTGDLSEATTVDVALTLDGNADASDVGSLSVVQVTFGIGEPVAIVTLPIVDDEDEEGTETLSVSLSNATGGAVIADGTATVTIAASDSDLQAPVGSTIFELDFETPGEAIAAGGFDGTLGDEAATLDEATSEVVGGKLVVQTTEGDINDGANNGSDNDFTKTVDLSDPALTEIFLTARFDNPFDQQFFTDQGLTGTNVPNYAQQGIVLGDGTQTTAQMVKLVWGGVAAGTAAPDATGIQMWSKGSATAGGFSQQATIAQMISGDETLFDVASIEMSLVVNKIDGTIGQYVTLFDDTGAVIGGTRPEATPGFFTTPPVTPVAANGVLGNIVSDAELTHVGVTSSDNTVVADTVTSFDATWDFLRLSSPQFIDPGDAVTAAIIGDTDVAEGGAAVFDITLSEDPTEETTVTVDVTAGSVNPASLPQDAELSTDGTQVVLTFQPGGGLTQSVTVNVADDTLPELAESFDVAISGIGITAGGAANVTTTIAANDGPVDSVNGTPAEGGDFSGDHLAPTNIGTLAEGATSIVATQQGDNAAGGRERDYITFTVADGQELTGIIIKDYEGGETSSISAGFMALGAGNQIPLSQGEFEANFGSQTGLLGGLIYGDSEEEGANGFDGNVLGVLGDGEEGGFGFLGFEAPLPAGTYTLWLNQGADVPSTVTLDLVTAAVPDVVLSIADAPTLEEAGDTGTTDLVFALTATKEFTGSMEVSFDQGGTPSTETVTFIDGVGELVIPVDNDDEDNNDDVVSITLTGATDLSTTETVVISSGAASATGTVTEDDIVEPVFERGDVVAAFNAGGPALTFEGIDFAAATSGTDGVPFAGGDDFTDNTGGNNLQPVFTGTIYETEINGDTDGDFTFSATVDPTKSYFVDLYFAEIFASAIGARQFDVFVEGAATPVLAAYDILAETNEDPTPPLDINTPVVVQLTDPIEPGENGAIDLSFVNVVDDRAKVSAIVIREAVEVDPTAVSVSVDDVVVAEDDATVTVTFTREGNTEGEMTVTYSTADGTATDGADYTGVSGGTVTFLDGELTATATIALLGDTDDEGDEDFTVTIDNVEATGKTITVADAEATVTLTDDDAVDPNDIDGDGILNTDDPFAYDGQNGAGRVLDAGVSFRQDFDTDTTDPFSAEAGFTGVIVNQDFDPAGTSESDPYGDRTTEATTSVSNGTFKTESSETDIFGPSSSQGANNTIKDNYQSAADVTGVESFSITSRAINPFPTTFSQTGGVPGQFASFGITIGAGGADDWAKLVFGAQSGGLLRVEFAGQNSFTESNESIPFNAGNIFDENTNPGGKIVLAEGVTAIDPLAIAFVDYALNVSKPVGFDDEVPATPATMQGVVTLLDANEAVIATITTLPKTITGSLLDSLAGNNPLTGGDGGIAYGISITDWSSEDANRFTGEWDYLEISGPNAAPTAVTLIPATLSLPEGADTSAGGVKLADIVVADDGKGTNLLDLEGADAASFVIVDGATGPELHLAQGVTLDFEDVAQLDVTVTVDDTSVGTTPDATADFALSVEDVNEAPTLLVTPVLTEVAEDADVSAGIKVADIVVTDDALGTNSLTLEGDDAALFAIVDNGGVLELQLASDAALDFETNAALDVTVVLDDPEIGTEVAEASVPVLLTVTDANDAPTITGEIVDAETTFGIATTVDLSSLVLADEDVGDTPALRVALANGDPLPAGITLNGTTLEVSETAAENSYDIAVFANDGTADSVTPVLFTVTVGEAPDLPPTIDQGIAAQSTDEDAVYSFTVPADAFADDGGVENLVLTATLSDDSPLPSWLAFDGTTFSGTPENGDVGTVSVKVLASDGENPPTAATFDLEVLNTNDAPTITGGVTSTSTLVGTATTVDLSTLVLADEDVGDTPELRVELANGDPLPEGITLNGTTLEVADTLAEASYEIAVFANDGTADSATPIVFSVDVTGETGPDPIRVQAEDLTLVERFRVENRNNADEGSMIRLGREQVGTATLDLSDFEPGEYVIRVAYFDENDGESEATIAIGDQSSSWIWDDDENSGSGPQTQSIRVRTVDTFTIDASTPTLTLTVDADTGELGRVDYLELQLVGGTVENLPPFAPFGIPEQEATEDTEYSLDLADLFFDPEEDVLEFNLVSGPAWLTLDGSVLSGTPGDEDDLVPDVTISVSDGTSTVTQVFPITIENINDAPTTDGIPQLNGTSGQVLALDLNGFFSDDDGDDLIITAVDDLPEGLSIVDGVLTGTPTAGGSFAFDVQADDGTETVTTNVILNVSTNDSRSEVTIEAEDFDLADGGFFVEPQSAASGEEVIRAVRNESAEATYTFGTDIAPGQYDVRVTYFDEKDGVSSAKLETATGADAPFTLLGEWDFSDTDGSGIANIKSLRELVFSGLNVQAGTILKLSGQADALEFLRIDKITLLPTESANFAPFVEEGIADTGIAGLNEVNIDLANAFDDPDGDALIYDVVSGPSWLQVQDGVLVGTPDEFGTFEVTVSATDGPGASGVSVTTSFSLTVSDDNLAPTVDVPIGALTIGEGQLLERPTLFSDPDDDELTYSLGAGAPDWLEIDPEFGVLTGTPGVEDIGTFEVQVIATDPGFLTAVDTVSITVENVNNAPEAGAPLGNQSIAGAADFSFALPADAFTDADIGVDPNETLTLTATLADGSDLPAWITFDPLTGTFSGTSEVDTTLSILVTATDAAGLSASAGFTLVSGAEVDDRTPIEIETEDFTGLAESNFFEEGINNASGKFAIRLPQQDTGSVSTELDGTGASGFYTASIRYYDETDGLSTARILVDGQEVGSWTLDGISGVQFREGLVTGRSIQTGNIRDITFDVPFLVEPGSVMTLEGTSDNGEFLRLDRVTLTPSQPPVLIATSELTVGENETAAGQISAAAIGTPVFSIDGSGADDALFTISPTGELSFVGAPDFEAPGDADGDNVFEVAVKATVGDNEDIRVVSVTVEDVNETPVAETVTDQTVEAGEAVTLPTLDTLFSDPEGNALSFQVDQLPDGLVLGADGVTIEGTPTTPGDTVVTVTATETDTVEGLSTQVSFTISVQEDGVPNPVTLLRINAFGPEVAAIDGGPVWQADLKDDEGTPEDENSPYLQGVVPGAQDRGDTFAGYVGDAGLIPATVPAEVLGSARSSNDPFSYAIPVADLAGNGNYTVNLYVAELFAGNQVTGERIYDISVEGMNDGVLNNFDPSSTGGGGDLRIISYDVTVTDGELNIDFAQDLVDGNDNPIINAIEILTNPAAGLDTDAPTAAITLTNPSEATGAVLVSVALDDASGIDPATLGAEDLHLAVNGFNVADASITFDGFDAGVASYSIAAPDGGWTDGLDIDVTLKEGEITDLAPGANANAETTQSLTIDIGGGSTGGGEDEVVYRINAGGGTLAATDGGPAWVGDAVGAPNEFLSVTDDRADVGGSAVSTFDGVPDGVFAEARSSDGLFSYDIPTSVLENGENYEVRLYFAEIFPGGQTGGFRNFDATLEGFVPAAFNNIDPGALFGGSAGVLTAQVKVTDGTLNIGFAQDVVQNPIISAIEVVKLATDVENPEPPVDPGNALDAFAAQDDLDTSTTYTNGEVGAAVLEIMTGNNSIQSSNFGNDSFEVTNTGDKKISAIFIDVSSALYPDSVFDPDGQGGDNAAKPWQINTGGNTGAFVDGTGYFLPGEDPLPNSGGSGGASNGGFKGAMVKFNPNNSGGFEGGETVGFSGDMDPNSIAGMAKGDVDGTAILSWDVGGISGHELIGSLFTVLFDDGTTASGQLASDGSSAGSHTIATQAGTAAAAPGIAINGVLPGETGTYGGTLPTITVTGNPGDRVQITMTKGFNPVTETDNGIAGLVEARLERYDFQANNAFDVQTQIVTIGADGTFDASTLFDYDDAINNDVGSGTFAGDDVAQIGFVATKVEPSGSSPLPIGPTTTPIYLTNDGGPVTGDPTGGTGADGYFEINGSGNNTFFKIQIEDVNGTGGTNPGGKWNYLTAEDELGNQDGFQGTGYYLFGSDVSKNIDTAVGTNELLEYTIFVPEEAVGTYTFNFIVSRDDRVDPNPNDETDPDGTFPGDQQNDLWLNFKPAEEAGNGDIDQFLTGNGANEAEPTSGGFIKVFGGPNNGNWGAASGVDGLPGNFAAQIEISEEGLYTIQIDGRSQGFHVDYFELFKGANPGAGAANSDFIEGEPGSGGGGDPTGTVRIAIDAAADDWEENGGAGSSDLEMGDNGGQQYVGLRFEGVDIGPDSVLVDAYIEFEALESNSGAAQFSIAIEDTESAAPYSAGNAPGGRSYVDEFVWTPGEWTEGETYRTPDLSTLIENVVGANGVGDGELGFLIDGIAGSRVAYPFGNDGGDAPELVLVFEDINIA